MSDKDSSEQPQKEPNVWLIVLRDDLILDDFALAIDSEAVEFDGLKEDDWLVLTNAGGELLQICRIYRIRQTIENREIYFDKIAPVSSVALADVGLGLPVSGPIDRITVGDLAAALPKCGIPTIDDVRLVQDEAYVRELLQLATVDDVLGPAMGPHELIKDMGVCERYLVGKLAPRDAEGGTQGLEGATAVERTDDEPEPELETHTGRHDTGAEFESTTGRPDPEADASDEIDTTNTTEC